MLALFCMENPLWEWFIAPAALISLGWWIHELTEWPDSDD